jgi:AcrR family transcriptional regulator
MTQQTSPRRQRNHDLMAQSILATARAIMREGGVAALSMQELARRLDVRAPSLYHYFSGKTAIYDALFQQGFTLFGEYLGKASGNAKTWQDELQLSFEAYMNFAMQNPELYQLCFERPVPGFVPSEQSLALSFGLLQQSYARVTNLLYPVIRTDLTPGQLGDVIIAMMHGLTALHLANEPHLPVGQGRFGMLIPAVISILDSAWSKNG